MAEIKEKRIMEDTPSIKAFKEAKKLVDILNKEQKKYKFKAIYHIPRQSWSGPTYDNDCDVRLYIKKKGKLDCLKFSSYVGNFRHLDDGIPVELNFFIHNSKTISTVLPVLKEFGKKYEHEHGKKFIIYK